MKETARIPDASELAHAFVSIANTYTLRNGVEWTAHDQIREMIEARDRETLREAEESKWISVRERLPMEGQKIIVWTLQEEQYMGYWISEANAVCSEPYDGAPTSWAFTHWMPLPEPPVMGGKEGE